MNKTQQDSAALQFQANWTNRGYEKGESQQFWLDLLSNVFGIQDIGNFTTKNLSSLSPNTIRALNNRPSQEPPPMAVKCSRFLSRETREQNKNY